jgi:hypothetical protein
MPTVHIQLMIVLAVSGGTRRVQRDKISLLADAARTSLRRGASAIPPS